MREIKFRAWTGSQIICAGERLGTGRQSVTSGGLIDRDGWIPMQFTGLKDKNGKEIYEGDIVRRGDQILFTEFRDGCFCFVNQILSMTMRDHNSSELEVIANIYENQDL